MSSGYKNPDHVRFFDDLKDDYEVHLYHGRNFYHGPSVVIDEAELQDLIRTTEVRLQWDQMGKRGLVVYPVVSDALLQYMTDTDIYEDEDYDEEEGTYDGDSGL